MMNNIFYDCYIMRIEVEKTTKLFIVCIVINSKGLNIHRSRNCVYQSHKSTKNNLLSEYIFVKRTIPSKHFLILKPKLH